MVPSFLQNITVNKEAFVMRPELISVHILASDMAPLQLYRHFTLVVSITHYGVYETPTL